MMNFQGKLLKIATNNMSDIEFGNKYEFFERYQGDSKILEILSIKLNFTFSLISSNLEWGRLLANNTWTGIIGKLASDVSSLLI